MKLNCDATQRNGTECNVMQSMHAYIQIVYMHIYMYSHTTYIHIQLTCRTYKKTSVSFTASTESLLMLGIFSISEAPDDPFQPYWSLLSASGPAVIKESCVCVNQQRFIGFLHWVTCFVKPMAGFCQYPWNMKPWPVIMSCSSGMSKSLSAMKSTWMWCFGFGIPLKDLDHCHQDTIANSFTFKAYPASICPYNESPLDCRGCEAAVGLLWIKKHQTALIICFVG